MDHHHVGMTVLEAKRSSSFRRCKEQRRSSNSCKCLTMPGLIWALLLITCYLIGAAPSPHSTWPNDGTFSNDSRFTVRSSSSFGSDRRWYSTGETEEEEDWMQTSETEKLISPRVKKAIANPLIHEHGKQNWIYLLPSSPPLGFSVSREGTAGKFLSLGKDPSSRSDERSWEPVLYSGEFGHISKGKAELKPSEDGSRPQGQGKSRINEDQAPSHLQDGATPKDSGGAGISARPNTTVEDLWISHELPWKATKPCASVEEMGLAAAGDTKKASLRLRRTIRSYFVEHGAERVRRLPPQLFCERSFVVGKAKADGFGNNMYKLLTAAGLAVILNRSLIIEESGDTNAAYSSSNSTYPFGEYVSYSDQAFSMREIKQLWVDNACFSKYNRPLVLKVDLFDSPANSSSLCEDWTKWTHPILWFKDTQDAVALQFLQKNRHAHLRSAAALVLGSPSQPDTRPNTFGELMMAIVQPKPEVREAVEWTLRKSWNAKNGRAEPPDIALHLRMQNTVSKAGMGAASACIARIIEKLPTIANRRPRIVVVSDTPSAVASLRRGKLAQLGEVIAFDYMEFLSSSFKRSSDLSSYMRVNSFLPPASRRRDWGPLPRWVAVVDFFLAARARHAVVSGAQRRVGTTYAQLVASLAAAYTLDDEGDSDSDSDLLLHQQPARFYSSFQKYLLVQGLGSQRGWGHSWRPFGGKLSCPKQRPQCALTPLLPYAWWDAPWQSPIKRDRVKMRQWGINIETDGVVTEKSVQQFCRKSKQSDSDTFLLALPKSHLKISLA